MKSPPYPNPAQQTFDQRFVECFTDFVVDYFSDDLAYLKKALLTAPLRESSDSGPATPSLILKSMTTRFTEDEKMGYSNSDDMTLGLYLRNLDQIKKRLLRKVDEKEGASMEEKTQLKNTANEAFALLQNVKDNNPAISLGKVVYDRREDRMAKSISRFEDGYYYGSVKCGQYHEITGQGVFTWLDGSMYKGGFLYGEQNGEGVLTWASGDMYEGEFRYKRPNGKGVLTRANGDRYEGEFWYGKPSGKGVLTRANGDMYEGDFLYGKPNGKGVITWPNGNRYQGEVLSGEPNGKGVFTRANGDRYEGEFHYGCQRGEGVITWPNGNRYQGEVLDGKPSGKGVFTWPNGNMYEGRFVPSGKIAVVNKGVLKSANGDILKSYDFSAGKPVYLRDIHEVGISPNTATRVTETIASCKQPQYSGPTKTGSRK